MSPVVAPTVGENPRTGVADLPNVTVAYPGEHWSNVIASGAIVPGEAVTPVSFQGKAAYKRATGAISAAVAARLAIATRVIGEPDVNSGSGALGPNELKNRQIESGEYVHVYRSGAFHTTLHVPRAWAPHELVTWNPAGARPAGKTGTGAWDVTTDVTVAVFEVLEFRPYSADAHEGLLTIRSLRTQH